MTFFPLYKIINQLHATIQWELWVLRKLFKYLSYNIQAKNWGEKVSLELMYLLSLINTSFSFFNLHLRSGNFTQFANYYIFKLFSWNRWQPITLGIQISLVTSNYIVVQSLFHSFQCFSSIRAIGNQLKKKKKVFKLSRN